MNFVKSNVLSSGKWAFMRYGGFISSTVQDGIIDCMCLDNYGLIFSPLSGVFGKYDMKKELPYFNELLGFSKVQNCSVCYGNGRDEKNSHNCFAVKGNGESFVISSSHSNIGYDFIPIKKTGDNVQAGEPILLVLGTPSFPYSTGFSGGESFYNDVTGSPFAFKFCVMKNSSPVEIDESFASTFPNFFKSNNVSSFIPYVVNGVNYNKNPVVFNCMDGTAFCEMHSDGDIILTKNIMPTEGISPGVFYFSGENACPVEPGLQVRSMVTNVKYFPFRGWVTLEEENAGDYIEYVKKDASQYVVEKGLNELYCDRVAEDKYNLVAILNALVEFSPGSVKFLNKYTVPSFGVCLCDGNRNIYSIPSVFHKNNTNKGEGTVFFCEQANIMSPFGNLSINHSMSRLSLWCSDWNNPPQTFLRYPHIPRYFHCFCDEKLNYETTVLNNVLYYEWIPSLRKMVQRIIKRTNHFALNSYDYDDAKWSPLYPTTRQSTTEGDAFSGNVGKSSLSGGYTISLTPFDYIPGIVSNSLGVNYTFIGVASGAVKQDDFADALPIILRVLGWY